MPFGACLTKIAEATAWVMGAESPSIPRDRSPSKVVG